MPATVIERYDSRTRTTGDRPGSEWRGVVIGTEDTPEARAALEAYLPAAYDDLDLVGITKCEHQGAGVHEWTAGYLANELSPGQPGDPPVFAFDTTGGTQHIPHSKETVGKYGQNGDTAPDNQKMIGASQDHVEGCDIVVPVYAFSETHHYLPAYITDAYKGTLFRLTGKTNNAAFRGCAAGECLFLGAAGSKRGTGDWEITFKFAASPNLTNIVIGAITVTSKKGWEYLWVRSIPKVIGSGETAVLTMMPRHAYVERVYDEADFADLEPPEPEE